MSASIIKKIDFLKSHYSEEIVELNTLIAQSTEQYDENGEIIIPIKELSNQSIGFLTSLDELLSDSDWTIQFTDDDYNSVEDDEEFSIDLDRATMIILA